MAIVNIAESYYLRANVPWSRRGGLVVAKRPSPGPLSHPGTAAAAATLAQAAYGAYGSRGRMVVAMKVAAAAAGKTYVRTLARDEKRVARHNATPGRIQALRAFASRGGADVNGNARGSGPAFAGAGMPSDFDY